ncbi:MAG: putative membrane protein YdgH [Tenericutes bacterium ADurb.Bin087]|nr:MAG: putative membrane protein YdgH [Tenericutes bacterium ADurb.Bin087]
MKKIAAFIVKFKVFFFGLWIALTIASIFMIPHVRINYDTTKYLPEDTRVKESLRVMEEEFGITGQASVMIEKIENLNEVFVYKDEIKKIPTIMEVVWLDSFVAREDINRIEEIAAENGIPGVFDFASIPGLNAFYKDKSALLQIVFTEDDHSRAVGRAIEEIREYLETIKRPYAMRGTAINAYYTQKLTEEEVMRITIIVVPIVLFILLIFTTSWVEPLIFLIAVGVAVLVNMGTNLFFPSVSFLTNSTASLLQLAISMDYSIFLLHAYQKERAEGLDKKEAMVMAMRKSFLSINSSMFTTAAGFLALMFMRYTIGIDLAAVMIKGILLSIISTFTFMPGLILYTDKIVEKTKHKRFFPQLGGLTKWIVKLRYVVPAILLLVIVPSYLAQKNNSFVYGEAAMSVSEGTPAAIEKKRIEAKFGKENLMVILVPRDAEDKYIEQEKTMIKQLYREFERANQDFEVQITSLSSLSDIETYIPNYEDLDQMFKDLLDDIFADMMDNLLTDEYKAQFLSDNYSRVILRINTETESPRAEIAVDVVETVVARQPFARGAHIIGVSPSVREIKNVVETDYVIVDLISIGFVFVILLVSFRSLILPFILVLVIQISIWINMAIPYLAGQPLIFIGYMIVSSVQLGATIDYAILFTGFYTEGRKTMIRREAIKYALDSGGHSILTSSLILTAAGYSLKMFSSIEGVASLGELIGRGAALSGLLVLVLLPQLLYLFDRLVEKTTWKLRFYKGGTTVGRVIIDDEIDNGHDQDPSLLS